MRRVHRSVLYVTTAVALAMAASAHAQDAVTTAPAAQPAADATSATANVIAPSPASTKLPPSAPRAARDPDTVADIVVTARRTEERLQDVPISITVFNQQQLDNRNIISAGDLGAYTPSLSTNSNFGPENTSFAIRGFTQEIGTTPSVAVYFADVVAPRSGASITSGEGAGPGNFFDLQNVQVLKGPQGTLFGRNTTGGAVLLVPQKPTADLQGYIEGSVGDYNMKRIEAVLNVPLGDKIRFRFGLDNNNRDGYLNNTSGIGPSHFDDLDDFAARASMVVDVTPNIENYTIGTYSRSDTNGSVPRVFACNSSAPFLNATTQALSLGGLACDQLARQQGQGYYDVQNDVPNARQLIEQYQVINTTTWRATDNLTIKNIVSYSQFRESVNSTVFGENFFLPNSLNIALGSTTIPLSTGANAGKPVFFTNVDSYPGKYLSAESTLSEEVQAQGRALDGRLNYQTGIYYEISDPLGFSGSRSPLLADCPNVAALQCEDVFGETLLGLASIGSAGDQLGQIGFRNLAAYGQGTFKITDRLSFTGGIRYTSDRTHGSSEHIQYGFAQPNVADGRCANTLAFGMTSGVTNPAVCRQNFSQNTEAPTWLFDLDYKPTDDMLLYAKYARGYRQGGLNVFAVDFEKYNAESVDSYELGNKNTFRGPLHATFDTDIFYNSLSNQQLQANAESNTIAPTNTIVNAGQSQIWGVEGEGSITPFHGFTLDGAYTYLNTLLESIDPPTLAADSPFYEILLTAVKGGRLTLSPEHKASLTGTYTLPVDSNIGRITMGATYVYTDSQISTVASPFGNLPATNIVNLNLNWYSVLGHPVDFSAFVTNLNDDHYPVAITGAYEAVGFESRVDGEPRMFGFRLKYHFGA